MSTMRNDPRLIADDSQAGIVSRLRAWVGRTDLGSLPVLIGLAVIWLAFQLANHLFLSPLNLTNLVLQVASTGVISVGIVLVLLLGEIDLSVGSISGLAGSIMAILNVNHGVPGSIAILAGLAAGAGIGLPDDARVASWPRGPFREKQELAVHSKPSLTRARNRALRARGLEATSSSVGRIGRRVSSRKPPGTSPPAHVRSVCSRGRKPFAPASGPSSCPVGRLRGN